MQKIKVIDIQSKPTTKGGTFYTITDEHDTKYGGFISELSEVRKGDVINADIQVKGKYVNILSFEFIEHTVVLETSKLSIYEAAKLTVRLMSSGVISKEEPLGCKVIELCSEAVGAINDLREKAKENIERMVQNMKEPANIQNLLIWCQSHGKKYDKTWLLSNQSLTEEELKNPVNIKKAYQEICNNMGWR